MTDQAGQAGPEPKPCPKYRDIGFKHGPAQEAHVCPYAVEINDDTTSLCECCEECAYECAMDV